MFRVVAKCLGVFAATILWSAPLFAADIHTTAYPYKIENEEYQGLISSPKGKVKGGVLVVHNWMGVTNETKKQAERFAELGYFVLSADIYGKGKNPTGPEQAGKLASRFKSDRKLFRTRLKAAFDELAKRPELSGLPLYAAGYCFGGTGVLELARSQVTLNAVFSFHGGLDSPTPADGANIKSSVYAFHGADDPFVAAADLLAFEKEMATHKVDWQLVKFGGAVHSFTDVGAGNDNSKGAAYNAVADARSWAIVETVLK